MEKFAGRGVERFEHHDPANHTNKKARGGKFECQNVLESVEGTYKGPLVAGQIRANTAPLFGSMPTVYQSIVMI